MVIGDDDQDILRWQRKKDAILAKDGCHEFAEKYFEEFERDFGGAGFEKLLLEKIFRSEEKIVKTSPKFD